MSAAFTKNHFAEILSLVNKNPILEYIRIFYKFRVKTKTQPDGSFAGNIYSLKNLTKKQNFRHLGLSSENVSSYKSE